VHVARDVAFSLALAAAVALAGGCAIGPDFSRPDVAQPEAFREGPPGESLANLPWWEVFGDAVLQELVREALAANQDVGIAASRVEEAAAALGFTRAAQFPAFGIGAGAGRAETSDQLGPIPGTLTSDYLVYANVSWEIDIWGRLRRATEASRAELLATEAARHGVTLTVVAAVADRYFQLRDLDNRLGIAQRTLASRRDSLELIRTRFRGGIVSELDVRQAEIEEATAAAAVPAFERSVVAVENALSVLLGRPPGAIPRGAPLDAAAVPSAAPPGLPAELLERRPDVREAEELAHAQMARVGIAEALRLPTLSLTGAAGLEADDLDDLDETDANFWSIGGNLVGPLFEFGRNQRRVEVERARTEQAILRYEATVLSAYRDVGDALAALRTGAAEYEARRRQVDSARAAARLSRARYDGGVTSYLEVLDSERSLFNAELQASLALQQRYAAWVQLYKALGGGWPASPASPASP
jgi:multidrug efflux system outer membrane protein